jgi:hypothetical protein
MVGTVSSEQKKEKEARLSIALNVVGDAVAFMRERGVTRLKMPIQVDTSFGAHVDLLELELGPEPIPLPLPTAEEKPAEAEEPPKRGPDGLTEDEAKLAYGHHRRR